MAKAGALYLSWNASVARVLVPPKSNRLWPEMKSGKYCIISLGPQRSTLGDLNIELIFEDHSDSPFAVQLNEWQSDKRVDLTVHPEGFSVTLWSPKGKVKSMPGKLRSVPKIPYLLPWMVTERGQ